MNVKFSFGSLFSGIGGLDLGLERAGMSCAFQVENDFYASRVLQKHWPGMPQWMDIGEVDWRDVERGCGRVDLVAGGFPCQDLSYAGKGAGLSGARSGLWSEFVRCLRHLRPSYVLVENVPGLLGRGMGIVLGELAALGYDAEWESVPAGAFGAPHLRWRVFIVAYSDCLGGRAQPFSKPERRRETNTVSDGAEGVLAYTDEVGRRSGQRNVQERESDADGYGSDVSYSESGGWREGRSRRSARLPERLRVEEVHVTHADSAGRSEQRRPLTVFSEHSAPQQCDWWGIEPEMGRVADEFPGRVEQLRGFGNAVVPQVGQWLGELILDHAKQTREEAVS